ncbi:MAG: hypothetical protein LBQ05_01795, partial [Christensenellaceae bacterium]|jgi:membrane peptidoglycan carboxypeptidase|nr:hypothetical protein [Christensenellaceae bacterium]
VDDSPLIGGDFNPHNIDGVYHGRVSLRECVEQSYNVPAVKIMNSVGVENATEIANRLGLNLKNENLSSALGNTTNGVSFTELLSGYQTLANSGKATTPKFVKSIRDRSGKIIYFDNSDKYNYRPQAIGTDTAYIMTDILCGVSKVGTGKKLKSLPFQIASKTGTTERENAKTNTDATFISYTTDTVLLVWVGNADMKAENDLPKGTVGGGALGFITRDIYRELTGNNNTPTNFTRPKNVVELRIDTDDLSNGDIMVANPNTPDANTKKALFSARYKPTEVSTNYLSAVAPKIDGQISNGTGEIWFTARPHQIYEIYKNEVLQEVIANKNGEYRYIDKYPDGENAYTVTAKFADKSAVSNELKLYVSHLNSANARKSQSANAQNNVGGTRTLPKTRPQNVPWYF